MGMTNEELTAKTIELDERVTRHTEQIKTCFNQITETRNLADSVHKLATSVELLTREQRATNEKVDGLSADVEEIKEKPAKRWDTVVTVVITALVSAAITYVLTRIGLG